jgi:hypothetical protein
MPIEIQRHSCCRVTKHALHDLDISARAYREGGRGVPQTMGNQPLNADLGAALVESTPVLLKAFAARRVPGGRDSVSTWQAERAMRNCCCQPDFRAADAI